MIQAATRGHALEDVLYQFALAHPRPDADAVEAYARDYPQFARDLTELALGQSSPVHRDESAEPLALGDEPRILGHGAGHACGASGWGAWGSTRRAAMPCCACCSIWARITASRFCYRLTCWAMWSEFAKRS